MHKLNVFLDDVRCCPEGFVFVESVESCIDMLDQHTISLLSINHELQHNSQVILDLLEYMVKHHVFVDHVIVHSSDCVYGKRLYNYLVQAQQMHLIPSDMKISYDPIPCKEQ